MADTAMMIKEVTGVNDEVGVDKRILKTLDETFSCSTYGGEGQPLLVVKKMVNQLVIKVVRDNEEEVVDKVTKMFFSYRGLVYFGPKLLRSEVACEFHQKLCD